MDKDILAIAEKCSRYQEVATSELPILRPYLESYLDRSWLNSRLTEYENWALKNSDPFLQHNFLHRPIGFNMLVAAIWAARYWENEHKSDTSFQPKMGAIRLINIACSLAVLELRAGQYLNLASRNHLKERLQSTEQLWGIIHELNTFAFFTRHGAAIEPHFLNKASVREVTLNWRGIIIPVQCKNLRPSTGRRISPEAFITLASYIVRDMRKVKKSLYITIGATGMHKIRNEDIDFLRSQVRRYAGRTVAPVLVTKGNRTYSILGQQLSNQFAQSLPKELHLRMVISEPEGGSGEYKPVAIVGIESNPIERPLRSLSDAIRGGVSQMQCDKPGILAIYYADPVDDFNSLCPSPQTMQLYISERLAPFPHVGAVILSSEPDYLGPVGSKAGKTFIFYRKPWAFPEDFLQDNL
ncbi:hypothetical protein ACFLV0_04530 [Chloroflexota bacterium]